MSRAYGLHGSDCFELGSDHVGDRFEVFVAHPVDLPGMPLSGPPRIVYCVDAEVYGVQLVEIARYLTVDPSRSIDPFLVVGIGYPDDVRERTPPMRLRNRDLVTPGTPIPDWVVEALGGAGPEPASDRFLAFIEEELDPVIRERYEHDSSATGFCGDSYGGLFGLYTLFRQSPLFTHYLIGSPGAVLDDDPVFAVEAAQFAAGVPLKGRAYFSIGEHEQADSGTAYETLGKNYLRLAALLRERAYPDLAWTAEILPGETHASVIPFALSRGMRWLFERDGLPLAPVRTLD
ncbi:MAG: alpha/beta hydrolase [Gammaproteobacteria bacterium]|nr:alpha/beta hydrolase [Gammaproteobacteria bacterium]